MHKVGWGWMALLWLCPGFIQAAPVTVDGAAVREVSGEAAGWGIGATTSLNQRPFTGVGRQQESLPYFSWQHGYFAVEGLDVSLDAWRAEGQSFGLLLTPRFYEVKDSFADDGELDGIEATSDTWFAGLNYRLALPADLHLSANLLYDVGGESDGVEAMLSLNRPVRLGAVSLVPAAALVWQDSTLVTHFYGVEADEVAPGRPRYTDESSLNAQVSLTAQWRPGPHWRLLGAVKAERLGDGIADSPIIDERDLVSALIGVVYQF